MIASFLGKSRFSLFLCIFSVLLTGVSQVKAQQFYPVQVRSFVQSPSVYVEDYQDPNNFRVQVTLTDTKMQSLDVVLKVFFKGPTTSFESQTGIDLNLSGGVTYTLSRTELERLLSPADINGLPTTIPEGTYVISFKVFEKNTMVPVSNALTDFTSAVVILNDPPLLTSPAKGEVLDPSITGQNFMFSWTPRSFSLNPQQQVKYRLIIAQIPPDRNPYDAFLTNAFNINQPIEDIPYNSFFYDPSLFPLVPGATYAWQVVAYEERFVNNKPEKISQRFRNEGKSDVFVFKVKEYCPPVFLNTPELRPNPATSKPEMLLSWNADPAHTMYEIKYRLQGSVQPWTIIQQRESSIGLGEQQLLKGKNYEYTVACKCTGWQEAVYGGTFMLPGGECEAPFPIIVSSNDEHGIALTWTKVSSANTYSVYYTNNNTGTNSSLENLTDNKVTLPALTSGSYKIHVDAVCSNSAARGDDLTLNFDEKNFAGNCPIPSPFTFLAKRPESGTDPLQAQLSWAKLDLHESFLLTYWHKDSLSNKHVINSVNPEAQTGGIRDNEFYNYTIQYTCKGGKVATTPQGGFRVEGGGGQNPVTPPTADCFPPAVHSAEAKSTTSARIDWKGVSGAEEYVVVYSPADGSGQEKTFTTTAANAKLTDLTPGITYKYKIRCRCGGNYSIDSEKGEFDLSKSYTNNKCDSVSGLAIKQITETEIQLAWPYPQPLKTDYDAHTAYTLKYKENGQVWDDAYTIDFHLDTKYINELGTQTEIKKTIDQLSSGTSYDIEVKARCGTEDAKANEVITGKTKEKEVADCSKGGTCDRSSLKPIATLKSGDTISIADYKVKIKTVEKDAKGTNLWKGTGEAEAPLIGFSDHVKFDVDFDSLFVNDQVCVVGGKIDLNISVQPLDDETRAKVQDLMAKTGQVIDLSKQVTKAIDNGVKAGQQYGTDAFNYFQGGDNAGKVKTGSLGDIATNGEIKNVTTGDNSITIDGKSYPVTSYPVLVRDKDGNVFSIDKGKSPVNIGHYDTSLKGYQDSIPSSEYAVTFIKNKDSRYAFDAWQEAYGKSVAMEPHYLNLGDKYYSAKAITPGETDPVDFSLSKGNKSNLSFVNREGFVFNASGSTLLLAGGPAKDAQEVLALYDNGGKKVVAGALLLASYPKIEKKVKLVTVQLGNNAITDVLGIEAQLDKAYNPIGINYSVELDVSFDQNKDWCDGQNCDFSTGGSGLLDNDYTGAEAKVIDAYINFKGEANLDKDAAYIFAIGITKAQKGDEELQGKMNFAKQFGFLYSAKASSQSVGRTLAHELGHGNYKLYHIFDNMYLGDAARNSDNLMSYNPKTDALGLNKLQWDVVHDPGVTWGIFKKDDDQKRVITANTEQLKKFANSDGKTITFATRYKGVLTLPIEGLESVIFHDASDYWVNLETNEFSSYSPIGAIEGFVFKEKLYMLEGAQTNYLFQDEDKNTYVDKLSFDKKFDKVVLGFPAFKNGAFDFYVGASSVITELKKANIPAENFGQGESKTQVPWDYYLDYLPSETEKVPAVFSVKFSAQAVDMVKAYVGDRELKGREATSLLRLIMLMSEIKNLFFCLQESTYSDAYKYYNLTNSKSQQDFNQSSADLEIKYASSVAVKDGIQVSEVETNPAKFVPRDMLISIFADYLKTAKQEDFEGTFIEMVNKIEAEVTKYRNIIASNKTLDAKLDTYKKDQNTCFFGMLKIDERIQLINKYSIWVNDWDELLGTKEAFFTSLILSTPQEDYQRLLQEINNDGDQHRLLWGLYDFIDGENCESFITAISRMHLNQSSSSGLTGIPSFTATKNICNSATLKNISESIIQAFVPGSDVRLFSETGYFRSTDGKIKFFRLLPASNPDFKLTNATATDWLDPFDYLDVTFEDDWQFENLEPNKIDKDNRIKKGTYRVPAIFLYMVLNRQKTITNFTALRYGFDAFVIATSIASGGGALVVVEAVAAGLDITFAASSDMIKSSGSPETISLFDDLETVVGLVDLAVNAPGIYRTVSNGVAKYSIRMEELWAKAGKYAEKNADAVLTLLGRMLSDARFVGKRTDDLLYTKKLVNFLKDQRINSPAAFTVTGSAKDLIFIDPVNSIPIRIGKIKEGTLPTGTEYVVDVPLTTNRNNLRDNYLITVDVETGGYVDEFGNVKQEDLKIIAYKDGSYGIVEAFDYDYLKEYNPSSKSLELTSEQLLENGKDIFVESKNVLGPTNKLNDFEVTSLKVDGVDYPLGAKTIGSYDAEYPRNCYIDDAFCFVKGTGVVGEKGVLKSIETIKIGDKVKSYDHEKNLVSENKVKKLFKRTVKSLTRVFIAGTTILATPNHPFFVKDKYIHAGELKSGDSVLTIDNKFAVVEKVATFDTTAVVYNFEVEKDHNYFVSDKHVLVHNTCGYLTIKNTPGLSNALFKKMSDNLISMGAGISVAQRKAFYDAVAKLESSKVIDFLNDFAGAAGKLSEVVKNPELVNTWYQAVIRVLPSNWRTDVNYLQSLNKVINDTHLDDHIRKGHFVTRGDGSISGIKGVHSKDAVSVSPGQTVYNQGDVRIKPGTKNPPNPKLDEVYEAEPEVYGLDKSVSPPVPDWKKKQGGGGKSTFYPDGWSKEKIQNEIAYVRSKITASDFDSVNNWYSALNSDGTFEIAIFVDDINDINSRIGSAFPLMP